jgi:hypothetical protein
MMDPDVLKIAQLLTIGGIFAGLIVVLGLTVRFVFHKTPRRTDLPAVSDDRFARLEGAVESIALEVERISEAQRFTAKVLSERLPERQPQSLPERGR